LSFSIFPSISAILSWNSEIAELISSILPALFSATDSILSNLAPNSLPANAPSS
jgi:hypothetical protein